MKHLLIFILTMFLVGIISTVSADTTCEPDSVTVQIIDPEGHVIDKYLKDDGRWEQWFGYLITCSTNNDTINIRNYPMRWPGSEITADSALTARADQMGTDLQKHFGREQIDWGQKLNRALDGMGEDIYDAMANFIVTLQGIEEPTGEQIQTAWDDAFTPVMWVVPDSIGLRFADHFNMTKNEFVTWIKDHKDYME